MVTTLRKICLTPAHTQNKTSQQSLCYTTLVFLNPHLSHCKQKTDNVHVQRERSGIGLLLLLAAFSPPQKKHTDLDQHQFQKARRMDGTLV